MRYGNINILAALELNAKVQKLCSTASILQRAPYSWLPLPDGNMHTDQAGQFKVWGDHSTKQPPHFHCSNHIASIADIESTKLANCGYYYLQITAKDNASQFPA